VCGAIQHNNSYYGEQQNAEKQYIIKLFKKINILCFLDRIHVYHPVLIPDILVPDIPAFIPEISVLIMPEDHKPNYYTKQYYMKDESNKKQYYIKPTK